MLTDIKGFELERYLEGLKMYIGVAESELDIHHKIQWRRKKIVVDVNDGENNSLNHYEKVSPYAVLFGPRERSGASK